MVRAADREDAITDETVRVVATRRASRRRDPHRREPARHRRRRPRESTRRNAPEGTVLLLPATPTPRRARSPTALRERTGAASA